MLPFVQTIQNQSTSSLPRGSAPNLHHQVGANMFPNMGFVNPQLANPYNNMNMNMANNGTRPPGFINMPNFNPLQQNAQLGSFPVMPQQFQQNFGHNPGFSGFPGNGQVGQNMNMGQGNSGQVFGQQFSGGWQNQGQGQNMNPLGNVVLNQAQIAAALSQIVACANQGMVPQNGAFVGNQQLGLVQSNGMQQQYQQQQQGNFGQQLPMGSQQLLNVPAMLSNPALVQPQLNQSGNLQMQGNHGIHTPNSGFHQNKNFMNNAGKNNWRSQKSHGHQMHNAKGKQKPTKLKTKKAIGSAGPDNSQSPSNIGNKRPLFVQYPKIEVKKWRAARKRNYPTTCNVQKKLAAERDAKLAYIKERDAALRRKELRKVLDKQAELGVEIAEIPSHLLANGRSRKRFNKKGRFDRTNQGDTIRGTADNGSERADEQFVKRQKLGHGSAEDPSSAKEPTLLQKLMSADMKRDRRRLLQALHFMEMNSFFKNWPQKPLHFPKVVVEEEPWDEDDISALKELADDNDSLNASVDSDAKHNHCHEEGEITD